MSALRAWWLAIRPKTLSAAAVPVVVGTAAAAALDRVAWWPAIAAMVGALAIQVGTNFANDVFDFEQGADREDRLGPQRAVASGLIAPRAMRLGMGVAFGTAFLTGVYLVTVGGWPIVVIGLASIASGIFYTASRYSLAYLGLGDLFVLVFFGFVAVGGTFYVQVQSLVPWVLWAALPIGAWATNIIVVNNLRDRSTDAKAGKKTLAVRFGRRFSLVQYGLLGGVAYLVPVGFVVAGWSPWLLAPWISLPEAGSTLRGVVRAEGKALNPYLGRTARMLVLFGLPWAAALAFSR
ncbi:MAG: 1,4-dihydroxy-2-naphthoate polyprenyltransferase [Myxococcota bacterium]